MNYPTPLKEKKLSANRLSVTSHSLKNNCSASELKHRGTSLSKKASENEEVCSGRQQGKYLVGWGSLPSLEHSNKIQYLVLYADSSIKTLLVLIAERII
jgi:hypothetical protein